MASQDHYMAVAKQVSEYMNAFRLAFKTYRVEQLDEMIKAVAGSGARAASEKTGPDLEEMLKNRGFLVFPSLAEARSGDGHFRVIRAGSIIANLLNSFRFPGSYGDEELARLLRALHNRRRPDDLDATSADEQA